MLDTSSSAAALIKLALIFGGILLSLKFKRPLWQAILTGCILLLVLTGMPMADWVKLPVETLFQKDFLIMVFMILGILMLSAIQGASGQSGRLVAALDRYLRWPRVRLVIFPALVGLLPMPGGALFSCPMLEAASHGMNVSSERKSLINYWFRHIWELAWPLYPGYILISSLLGLPLLTLLKYTAPLVLFSFLTGWFFFMRDIKPLPEAEQDSVPADTPCGRPEHPVRTIVYEALPMLVTILGAALFGSLFSLTGWHLPMESPFLASLSLALVIAVAQGRGHFSEPLVKVMFNKSMRGMLILVFAIYVFKNIINASGIVDEMGHMGSSRIMVYLMFALLPFVCGALTGIMVGYVGACFPILFGLLSSSGLQDQTLSLVIVAMVCGNIGQLSTPLHICVVVTLEYYKVRFVDIFRKLLPALSVQFVYGVTWAAVLYLVGARL